MIGDTADSLVCEVSLHSHCNHWAKLLLVSRQAGEGKARCRTLWTEEDNPTTEPCIWGRLRGVPDEGMVPEAPDEEGILGLRGLSVEALGPHEYMISSSGMATSVATSIRRTTRWTERLV